MSRPGYFTPGKSPETHCKEAGCAPGQVWSFMKEEKYLVSTGN